MSTIQKIGRPTARKSTLKRTTTALTSELTKRGMPFKSSSKSVKITKENKTIKFYKDNFRQLLSLVILENNDNTLKNNLKEFYNVHIINLLILRAMKTYLTRIIF